MNRSRIASCLLAAAIAAGAAGCGADRPVERNAEGIVGRTFNGLTVKLPDRPVGIAAGEGAVWVTSMEGGVLSKVDPDTGRTVGKPLVTSPAPYSVEAAFGKIWVATLENDYVVRVDPATAKVIDRIKVDNRPFGLAAGYGYMWVTSIRGQSISRLDPRTGERVGERIALSGVPFQVAAGFGYVWVTNIRDGLIDKIDPRTGSRVGRPIETGDFPGPIAAAGRYLWVANVRGSRSVDGRLPTADIWRIDPRTGRRVGEPIPVPVRPHALAANDRDLWVTSLDGNAILHIDVATGRRDKLPLLIGEGPGDVAIVPDGPRGGDVWVSLAKEDRAARIAGADQGRSQTPPVNR